MKHDEMWDAHYYAQQAANDLITANAIYNESGRISPSLTDSALRNATKFAAALGYDLVKREEKQEAA
jgi:hypothetical protein